ncbi:MAG TPA: hypothetical protein VMU75_04560 [Acidimicrobiales bacterium]|nr:hypothetical protein [Acidimicrobiales bacterium]
MGEASREPRSFAGPAEDTLSVIAELLAHLDEDDPAATIVRALRGCAGIIRYADRARFLAERTPPGSAR